MSNSAELDEARRRVLPVYQSMAAKGDAFAIAFLSRMHLSGLGGLSKNEPEALRLLRNPAVKEFPHAMTNLGFMHSNGLGGLPKNEAEALRLYQEAAAKGLPLAIHNIGCLYVNGAGGLPKNEPEAFRYFHEGAQKCGSFASSFFNWMNANRLDDVASTLYRAYEANEASVMTELANMYWGGIGVSKNDGQALLWLRRAVEKGNLLGIYRMGWAYENGVLGLPKNHTEAIRLYTLAQHEIPDAKSRLESLHRAKFLKETAREVAGEAMGAAAKALIRSFLK